MALLSPAQVAITGTAPAYVAASAGGDTVNPSDRLFLHVKNGSASAVTVTVVVPGSTYGQANPDVPVSVPAGGDRFIGPLGSGLADPTSGTVGVTYSAVASVTVAAVQC